MRNVVNIKYSLIGLLFLTVLGINWSVTHSEEKANAMSIYDFKAKTIEGVDKSMADYKGKVILVVNVASKCGFTKQYEGLQALYSKYKDRGLEILGFPCNQFGSQEPGTNEEIKSFCSLNYGVNFQIFDKIDVNGDNAHPIYKYLTKAKGGVITDGIKWNFTKFLIDKQGNVVDRFAPTTSPESLEDDIEKLL